MALRSCTCQSPCVNILADSTGEQDELAGTQSPARRSNARSNKAPIKAHTPLEGPTPPLVPPPVEDLFTKFMKVFMKTTQAQDQESLEPREHPFKAKTLKNYSGKSQMNFYHFCQQCEDYFETLGTIKINCTLFATTFFHGIISLR